MERMESKKDQQQKMNTTDAGCSLQWKGAQFQSKHRRAPRGSWPTLPCPTQSLGSVFLWPSPIQAGKGISHRASGASSAQRRWGLCVKTGFCIPVMSSKDPPFEKLFSVKLHKIREKGCPWAYCFLFWICSRWSDTNVHAQISLHGNGRGQQIHNQ